MMKKPKAFWKSFNRLVFQLNLKISESNGVNFFQNCGFFGHKMPNYLCFILIVKTSTFHGTGKYDTRFIATLCQTIVTGKSGRIY